MHDDKLKVSRIFFYLVICFGALYLIYSDSVTIPFAFHDQVRYFGEDYHHSFFKEDCSNDHIAGFLFKIGRPVAGGIECLVFENVHVVEDLSIVRLIVIALYAICMALIAIRLELLIGNRWVALFLSGSIFALPGPNVLIFQGGIPNALALLLAILSYMTLPKVMTKSDFSSPGLWIRISIALGLLSIALLAYPTYAYFFFFMTMVTVLFSGIEEWPSVRMRALRDLIFVGIASGIYFVLARVALVKNIEDVAEPYKFKVAADLPARLSYFWEDVAPMIFNMWNIYVSEAVAMYVIAFISSGVVASAIVLFVSARPTGQSIEQLRFGAEKTVLVLVLFFAVNGAWIVSSSILVLFRIFFPATAMSVVLSWWAATKWMSLPLKSQEMVQKAVLTVACLMFLSSGVFANFSMNRNVWNTSVELMYIRSQLAAGLDRPIARIHVIRPKHENVGYNKLPSLADEFNTKGVEFKADITDMVRTALLGVADSDSFIVYGCNDKPEVCVKDFIRSNAPGMLVTQSRADEPIYESPNTLIIDMRDLVKGIGHTKAHVNMVDLMR